MTVEEAYAGPVTRKRRGDRAFLVGLVVGIAAGVVATWLLNRAADAGEVTDDEAVVELQPALASDPTSATTRLPITPLDGTSTSTSTSTSTGKSTATNGSHDTLHPAEHAVAAEQGGTA